MPLHLSAAVIRDLLNYDPVTGVMTWKNPPSTRVKPGSVAGYTGPLGFRQIGLHGEKYYAHRLIHVLMTGRWPKGPIHHANGNHDDNCWRNIRGAA